MGQLMVSWVDQLQVLRPATQNAAKLGWNRERNEFTFPHIVLAKNGKHRDTIEPARGTSADAYAPNGELADWINAAGVVTEGDPALQVLLASTFAAPLLTLAGMDGFTLSIRSDSSGVGKTTVMKLAQAAWGSAEAMAYKDDTLNSIMRRLGDAPNMPFYWDEARLRGERAKSAAIDLIFNLPRGREKTRMMANTSLREPQTWSTILALTTNFSLYDLVDDQSDVDPSAFLARVFELEAAASPAVSPQAAALLNKGIDAYGHAGVEFMRRVLSHYSETETRLDGYKNALAKRYAKTAGLSRYYQAFFAALFTAVDIVVDMGLVDFDAKMLRRYIIQQIDNRIQSAVAVVGSYAYETDSLKAVGQWALTTPERWIVTLAAAKASSSDHYRPRRAPWMHIDTHGMEIIVKTADVRAWLQTSQRGYSTWLRGLPDTMRTPVQRTFAPRTASAHRTRCFVFPIKQVGLMEAVMAFLAHPPITGPAASHDEII